MQRLRRASRPNRAIDSYDHRDKERLNNPRSVSSRLRLTGTLGLDPQLQWAGKAEHTSFEVPTVSLHLHEHIDPRTIIGATRKHRHLMWRVV